MIRSLLVLPAAVCLFPFAAHAQDCSALAQMQLPQTVIRSAETVTGTVTPPYGTAEANLPTFCRVRGVLQPAADSYIRFEVWMPEKNWNRRFIGTGNGGFGGTIYYGQLAGNVRRGYATAGTDSGHEADAEDASWAYHHPEKVKDFGWRALHLTTERAKQIVAKYYGAAPEKAYFDGCSDGGREALMEAQRFPADYNGILAGAPANDWTHLLTSGLSGEKPMLANPAGYISSLKLPAITEAVLAQCDAQDGLKDGIVSDPRACHFDPATLACKGTGAGSDTLSCLTPPQVTALRTIYDGGKDDEGHTIFPGLMPGAEASLWKSWIIGEGPGTSLYLQNYFRYMVLGDATWDPLTADVDQALQAANAKTSADLNATNPDLSRFAARGGKLILYHGWNDPAISPLNTVAYYGQVQKTMGAAKARETVRLYMVPGMGHCTGGPGPSAFGQFGLPTVVGPKFGLFDSLEGWVEHGTAPGDVVATKYSAAMKVEMTRPLCPYPEVAKYKVSGDVNQAASFACVAPQP